MNWHTSPRGPSTSISDSWPDTAVPGCSTRASSMRFAARQKARQDLRSAKLLVVLPIRSVLHHCGHRRDETPCCATRADALVVAPRLDGGYHRAAVTNDCCLGPAVTRQDDYGRRRGAAVPVGVGTTFAYDGETVTIVKMAAVPSRPCQRVPAAARTQRGCVAISSGAVYQFRGPRRGGDPAAGAADREPGGDVDRCGRGGQNALSIFRGRTGCPSMRLPLLIFL